MAVTLLLSLPVLECAHKAVHPLHRPLDFHHSPLTSLVMVLFPSSALRQHVCHPFLFVPWYSSWPLSPVLGLTLALPEDVQGLRCGCSPWGAQGLYLAPDIQPSSARCSAFNAQQLRHNASSVLWKMHCWRFWETYFPLPLQRKVVRLQCNSPSMCVAQPNHLSPYPCRTRDQVQARPQQREKHLCAKLSVASPPPLQLYCPSVM